MYYKVSTCDYFTLIHKNRALKQVANIATCIFYPILIYVIFWRTLNISIPGRMSLLAAM